VQKCNAVVLSLQKDDFNRAEQFNLDKLILLIETLNRNGTVLPILATGNGLNKLFSAFLPEVKTVLGEFDRARNISITNEKGAFFSQVDSHTRQSLQTDGLLYFSVIKATLTDMVDSSRTLSQLFQYTSTVTDAFNHQLVATI
jgi:hypothetical protein